MKYTKHLLILSAVMVLLSSCGSLSITQKRYSRGLNIDWFTAKDEKTTKVAKPRPNKVKSTPEAVAPESETIEPEMVVAAELPETAAPSLEAVSEPVKVNSEAGKKAQSNVKPQKQNKVALLNVTQKSTQPSKIKQIKEAIKAAKANDVDLETIVLIILCIVLPPLAVFLYYMEANGQFWLNLLIYLLGVIAILYLSRFFYLLAVIHALLVVLGMIG